MDSYDTTDPLKEMSELKKDMDESEAALKWIALAVLHGINTCEEKITIGRSQDRKVKVTAK